MLFRSGLPAVRRAAHFYCAMALVRNARDPAPLLATGKWRGRILEQPTGDGGFGYDPLFYLPERGVTSAELTLVEKNQISHRGQAVRAARDTHRGRVYLDRADAAAAAAKERGGR